MVRPASAGRVRLAGLIDAKNASASHAQAVFKAAKTLGQARARRVYGDFSNGRLASWSAAIRNLSYRAGLDGFVLVSSDSDFIRLAQRLREGGFAVFGFGEGRTPRAFRSAWHCFETVGKAANGAAAAAGRGA